MINLNDLQLIRVRIGKNQWKIGKEVGVSQPTISNMELLGEVPKSLDDDAGRDALAKAYGMAQLNFLAELDNIKEAFYG